MKMFRCLMLLIGYWIGSGLFGLSPSTTVFAAMENVTPTGESSPPFAPVPSSGQSQTTGKSQNPVAFRERVIPFFKLFGGDPSKAFIHLSNFQRPQVRNPNMSVFALGQGLGGQFPVPRFEFTAAMTGQPVYIHMSALSNPPLVNAGTNEFHMQFPFQVLQFKGYYRGFSTKDDNDIPDAKVTDVSIDVFISPWVDNQRRPTFNAVRVEFNGILENPKTCLALIDVLYPVNVCEGYKEALEKIKEQIETGLRESLQSVEFRKRFDQLAWNSVLREIEVSKHPNLRIHSAGYTDTNYVIRYTP